MSQIVFDEPRIRIYVTGIRIDFRADMTRDMIIAFHKFTVQIFLRKSALELKIEAMLISMGRLYAFLYT